MDNQVGIDRDLMASDCKAAIDKLTAEIHARLEAMFPEEIDWLVIFNVDESFGYAGNVSRPRPELIARWRDVMQQMEKKMEEELSPG